MNIFKNKASSILLLFLILCFTAVAVRADTGKRSLFAVNPVLFDGNYLPGLNNLPATEQSRPMNGHPQVSNGKIGLEVLAGIAGNVVLGLGSAVLFAYIWPGDRSSLVPISIIPGYYAGALFGSTLGVFLVGNMGNVNGTFGNALLGSFLGEIVSLGLMLLSPSCDIVTMAITMTILPPVGAAILFHRSLRYRNLPEGNGLVNFNKDKLALGIPDMQIRLLPVYGKNMKTEIQFKINLLSVTL